MSIATSPPPIRYLEWALEKMPLALHDLATSGVPTVPADELGPVERMSEWAAHTDFVALIADRYGVPSAEVVPALGAAGGLWLLVACLIEPGDDVLVEEPAYEPVHRLVEGRGGAVRRFARRREDGWRIDAAAIVAALGPHTRAVVVTNPHNPTGAHFGDEDLRPLANALGERGVELVVDEVYRELCEPRATARRLGDHVSVVSSMTKCFGLGWARAGWMIARPDLVERARSTTLHLAGVLPSTVSAIGARGLLDVARLDARARGHIEGKRERVRAFVEGHRELRWCEPHPALHFGFVEDVRGRDLHDAIMRGLERERVLVVPGAFFGVPSAFRMSWTLPSVALDEALARLARALELTPA